MLRYNYNGVSCENCEGYKEVEKGKLLFDCSIKNAREYPNFDTASRCLRERNFRRKPN